MKTTGKSTDGSREKVHLGIDIGSISINTVLLTGKGEILEDRYDFCNGKPFLKLREVLSEILRKYTPQQIASVSLTGTGGRLAADLLQGRYVNEIIAQSESVGRLYPDIRTVIEMGGEDSKLIFMDPGETDHASLSEFELNSICAAGTGSFLDQQAKRIGVKIEGEFGRLALQSENPPRIAGRCSVFAKSDMIHLQQVATPVHDIVAGLCFAVARNFISTIGRGKQIEFPVLFQGGVAANEGMIRAFRELLNAAENDLRVPRHHASMGAIGSVFHTLKNNNDQAYSFPGTGKLEEYLESREHLGERLDPIKRPDTRFDKSIHPLPEGKRTEVSLGLDIGSLSTNIVLIDEKNRVVARRYLPTASKPLDAIRRGLSEVFEEAGDKIKVTAAGTTGSGRYLTGDFIGADVIRNEITAQATAAIAFDKKVDTIFEIGGQDSKYIRIDDGIVTDFEMNKVCAAGTGSFLEEQAEKLDINIIKEFEELAFTAKSPPALGDRCTVFMESDLNSQQQKGTAHEDLVAGLAYSIVQNYIQKVVRKKRIGNHILFQGGVTNNKAVVSAFEQVTGKKIYAPPHFDITGAIGAAILAREYIRENQVETRFKGYDISKIPYKLDRFTCKACSNQCEIRRVRIEGESRPLYYGGRCEKYELDERKGKGEGIPNYFEERLQMLLSDFEDKPVTADKTTIGIPRGLMLFYQQFPFWRTFFEELGFQVVLSDESNDQLIKKALDTLTAETCYPVEVMQGHIRNLLEKGVDYIFTPFIINAKAEEDNPTNNCNCPWIQTYPFMAKPALTEQERDKLLIPALNFRYFGRVLNKELSDFMSKQFKVPRSRTIAAISLADKQQTEFENNLLLRGQEVLNNLPEDKYCLVIMGRPYNTGDPALNLSMVDKLINLDVLPIPMDFLPLGSEHITQDYNQMYWPNGQKILSASRIIARDDRLYAVYMGNFRCGPDSFLAHFVHEEMRSKPYLEIEIDEHSADAGMITRYEAFLDSLKGVKNRIRDREEVFLPGSMKSYPMEGRTLYFPYMYDGAYTIAAASRACGLDADVLPMTDKAALELGRKYTSSRECFPMICTTGSFLKKILEPGADPTRLSFFMPDHNGPCRFGQYNRFQRIVFDRLGFKDVKIVSPSNETAYADISGGKATKFRFLAWKGFVAVDLLRKLKQERKPYEMIEGSIEKAYRESLALIINSIENGAKDLTEKLELSLRKINQVSLHNGQRKPVVAIVGEIFMRDNPFCNGYTIQRLEKYGAETYVAPFSEWLTYSTYRYTRDSLWKGRYKGLLKSKIQEMSQTISANKLHKVVHDQIDAGKDIQVKEMLELCGAYVHRHYDGDPALNLGNSAALVNQGISGIVNILPFTCMPGTLVASVSDQFKKDHDNIPYLNIAYDGQEDASIEMRIQAFMHQAKEFAERKQLNSKLSWV